jgi:hypothetical protein
MPLSSLQNPVHFQEKQSQILFPVVAVQAGMIPAAQRVRKQGRILVLVLVLVLVQVLHFL